MRQPIIPTGDPANLRSVLRVRRAPVQPHARSAVLVPQPFVRPRVRYAAARHRSQGRVAAAHRRSRSREDDALPHAGRKARLVVAAGVRAERPGRPGSSAAPDAAGAWRGATTEEARSALAGASRSSSCISSSTMRWSALEAANRGVVLIIDEAQTLPIGDGGRHRVAAASRHRRRTRAAHSAFGAAIGEWGAGDSSIARRSSRGARAPAAVRSRRVRALHRASPDRGRRRRNGRLQPARVEVIYAMSGGLPRLVNLICERVAQRMRGDWRAPHRAADHRIGRVGPGAAAAASQALSLVPGRPAS